MRWKAGHGRFSPRIYPRDFPKGLGSFGLAALLVLAVACGAEPALTPAVTPVLSQVAVQTPEPTGELAPDATTVVEVTPQPSPASPLTPTPEPAQTTPASPTPEPVSLLVLTPPDNIGVEVGAIRVAGLTSGNKIGINGIPVEVLEDGTFERDLILSDGVNLIEVLASGPGGGTTSRQLVVFYVSPTAGLPFTLLYPPDGLTVSQPEVNVLGVTTLDAIVGVNQIPVEINSFGVFSASVTLEEGANLVEVVATNIQGNIRFQTVAVFYTP